MKCDDKFWGNKIAALKAELAIEKERWDDEVKFSNRLTVELEAVTASYKDTCHQLSKQIDETVVQKQISKMAHDRLERNELALAQVKKERDEAYKVACCGRDSDCQNAFKRAEQAESKLAALQNEHEQVITQHAEQQKMMSEQDIEIKRQASVIERMRNMWKSIENCNRTVGHSTGCSHCLDKSTEALAMSRTADKETRG